MGLKKFFRDVKETMEKRANEDREFFQQEIDQQSKKQNTEPGWTWAEKNHDKIIEKHTVGDVDLDNIEDKKSATNIFGKQGEIFGKPDEIFANVFGSDNKVSVRSDDSETLHSTSYVDGSITDNIENNEFKNIIDTIQKDFPAENIIDEKELQGGLRIFLKTKFPDSDIQREVHTDDSVLDLLVDQKYAFEVKVPRNRTELRNLRGQIEEYKEHFPNLCVVIYENEDYNMLEDIKKYVDIYKEKYNVPSVVLQGKKRK